jgi:hypothetical protein
VLIIDDTSPDDTPAVGQALAANDSRVEYRRHATNKGHIATYNEGLLEWAQADYSLLISADDVLAPGALKRAADLMDRHPDVGMTYGMASIIVDDSDPPEEPGEQSDAFQVIPSNQFLEYCCRHGNPVPTPTAVVRTTWQKRLGGYLREFPHTADFEMWMKFSANGPVGIHRAVQGYYRLHRKNMSTQYYLQPVSDHRARLLACRSVLAQWEGKIPGFRQHVDNMAGRMSQEALRLATQAFEAGDPEGCATCLAFAAEASPAVTSTSLWWKFRIKQALGPALWRKQIEPLLQRLRGGEPEAPHKPPAFTPASHGEEIGWWPAASGTPHSG